MILALDIGGTHIRSGVVAGTKIKEKKNIETPEKRKDILKAINDTISSYKKPKAICISIAGFERKGIIQNSLNLDINFVPLSKILKKKFKVPVYIENDASCAALAEFHHGTGKKHKNFILITLGTGIGGGAILNGKLYRGRGGAMEPGSMRIFGENPIWEKLASGDASVRIARLLFKSKITSRDIERLADKGNKKAKAVYNKIGNYLGIGIANLAYIFDPEAIIIGGGFSRVKYIYPEMHKTFSKLYHLKPKPPIIKAKFGDDAGLIGAALLPKEK